MAKVTTISIPDEFIATFLLFERAWNRAKVSDRPEMSRALAMREAIEGWLKKNPKYLDPPPR